MKYERNFDLINRKFKELLIPTMAVSIAGNFAILADAFLISFIMGSEYLAVVQSIEPFALLVCVVYWMIGLGGSVLCSIAKADFDDGKANTIFTVALLSNVIIGLAIAVSCLLFSHEFTQILCHSPPLMPFVQQYLLLYIIGVPSLCYIACMAYFIKSYGFIKLQFWTFLISNIINVIGDILFMKYMNLGIVGAGLATSVGFIVGSIIITSYFFHPKRSIKLIKVKGSAFVKALGTICKTGFSSSARHLYDSIKFVFINYLLTIVIGTVGLEAFNMCNNMLFIVMIFILGTIQSIVPIVSVYFKEEDYRGVAYVCKKSVKIIIGFGLFFSVLFYIFPNISLYLFNVHNPDSVPVIMNAVRLYSLCFIGYAITNLYVFYAQSAQFIKLSNTVALLEGLVLPLFFVYLFSYFWGVNGIWIAFTASELLTILYIFINSRYMSKKTDGELSGFFLNRHNEDKNVFEYTIKGTMEDVEGLLKIVKEATSYSNLSKLVGLAIEEMLVNIIEINDVIDLIDIIVRDKKDSMVISLKYSGIVYNPLKDDNSDKLSILAEYADNIDYSQILELNNIEISLKDKMTKPIEQEK